MPRSMSAIGLALISAGLAGHATAAVQCPTGWNLYVVNQGHASVAQFALDDDGHPRPLTPPSVAVGVAPTAIALDAAARHAYVSALEPDTVSQFSIDPDDGGLRPLQPAEVAAGSGPSSIVLVQNHAYVSNNGDDTLSQYAIDPHSGSLRPLDPPTAPAHGNYPAGLVVGARGAHLYVAALRVFGLLGQYAIEPGSGRLHGLQPATVATCASPVALATAAGGHALWVACADLSLCDADEGPDCAPRWAIGQLRVEADGTLLPLRPSSVEAPAVPSAIVASADGRFVYVAGAEAAVVAGYRVAPDGRLTPMATSPVASGQWTSALALHPDGRFLYALGLQDNTLHQYAIDPSSGALRPLGITQSGLDRPLALAIGCRGQDPHLHAAEAGR